MNVALGIGAGLVLVIVLLRVFENRLIFFPPRYPEGFASPEDYGIHPEEIWLNASDGIRLNAYFLSQPESQKALLWFHGNAENIGMGLDHLKVLSRMGVNGMALGYRGYGRRQGSSNEAVRVFGAGSAHAYLRVV